MYRIGWDRSGQTLALLQGLKNLVICCPRCGQQSARIARETRLIFRNASIDYRWRCRSCGRHDNTCSLLDAMEMVARVAPEALKNLWPDDELVPCFRDVGIKDQSSGEVVRWVEEKEPSYYEVRRRGVDHSSEAEHAMLRPVVPKGGSWVRRLRKKRTKRLDAHWDPDFQRIRSQRGDPWVQSVLGPPDVDLEQLNYLQKQAVVEAHLLDLAPVGVRRGPPVGSRERPTL